MSFIDQAVVQVQKPLMEARYEFDRARKLRETMMWCATDYYTKASVGKVFEARGILVIGDTRQGKSTEIQTMLDKFNDGSTIMPDGRPAKIVSCLLSGRVTWKDLGTVILEELGYSLHGRNSQTEIWAKVRKYAQMQGVVGIHFDECQHVFTAADSATNQKFLDSFKSLLKDQQWPLMLIFSGIPSLEINIQKEEQLYRLLRTIKFEGIKESRKSDMDDLVHLIFSYADKARLEIDNLLTEDFPSRLACAACYRWGLVIELLIEAFTSAASSQDKTCTLDHFSAAFSNMSGISKGYSPFTAPDFRRLFNEENMMDAYEKTREKRKLKKPIPA